VSPDSQDGFLTRWSRRKALVRQGEALPEPALPAAPVPEPVPTVAVATPSAAAVAEERPPAPPTLDDVARLTQSSDYRRFVAADVAPDVRNAALKKLFTDPQFNVMDGLDTYIDDYGKPDPIPASMLRQMVQSQALGLFADEEKEPEPTVPDIAGATPDGAEPVDAAESLPEPSVPIADDQDAAVRLQPLDTAGPNSDPGGTGQDAGRQR
jgi:Protein of unknown function (DUF3306)